MKKDYAIDRGRPHDELPSPWRVAVDAILEEPTPVFDPQRLHSEEMAETTATKTLLLPNVTGHSVNTSALPRLQVVRYGSAIAATLTIAFALIWSGVFARPQLAFAQD